MRDIIRYQGGRNVRDFGETPPKKKKGDFRDFEFPEDHADGTKALISRNAFLKLVREIAQDWKSDCRMAPTALMCLQEAAEAYLVSIFQDANLCMVVNDRKELQEKDWILACMIRREPPPKVAIKRRNSPDIIREDPKYKRIDREVGRYSGY